MGITDKISGRIKKAAGDLSDDASLRRRGRQEERKGEAKDDPFIGRTEILRGSATLRLPFIGGARPGAYRVSVTAQGCAEDKVCYAPFAQVVRVSLP